MGPKTKSTTQSRMSTVAREIEFVDEVKRRFNEAADSSAKKGGNFVEQSDELTDFLDGMKNDQLYRILTDVLGFPRGVKSHLKTPNHDQLVDYVVTSKIFRDVASVMSVNDVEKNFSEADVKFIVEGIMWAKPEIEYQDDQLQRGQKTYKEYLASMLFDENGASRADAPKLSEAGVKKVRNDSRLVLKGGKDKIPALKKHLALLTVANMTSEDLTEFYLSDDDYRLELAIFADVAKTKKLPQGRTELKSLVKRLSDFAEEHLAASDSEEDESDDDESSQILDMSQSRLLAKAAFDAVESSEDEEEDDEPQVSMTQSLRKKSRNSMVVESDDEEQEEEDDEEQEEDDEEEEEEGKKAGPNSPDGEQFVGEYTPDSESIYHLLMCLLDLRAYTEFDTVMEKPRVGNLLRGKQELLKILTVKRTTSKGLSLVHAASKLRKVGELGKRMVALRQVLDHMVEPVVPGDQSNQFINMADYREVKKEVWLVAKHVVEGVLYCTLCEQLKVAAGTTNVDLEEKTVKQLKGAAGAVKSKVDAFLEGFREQFDHDVVASNVDSLVELSEERLRGLVGKDGNSVDIEKAESFMSNYKLDGLAVSCKGLVAALKEQCRIDPLLESRPDLARGMLASKNGEGILEAAAWAGIAEVDGKKTQKHGTAAKERSRSARKAARDEVARRASSSSSSSGNGKKRDSSIISKDLFGSDARKNKRARSVSGTPRSASTDRQGRSPYRSEFDYDIDATAPQDEGLGNDELANLESGSEAESEGEPAQKVAIPRVQNGAASAKKPTPLKRMPLVEKPLGVRRMPFTEEEDLAIVEGMMLYKFGNWQAIVTDVKFCEILQHRTAVNIKDRVRTLRRLDLYDFRSFDKSQRRYDTDPVYRKDTMEKAASRLVHSADQKRAQGAAKRPRVQQGVEAMSEDEEGGGSPVISD